MSKLASRKVGLARLSALADFLDSMPRSLNKKFYMGSVLRLRDCDGDDIRYTDRQYRAPALRRDILDNCGSAACAAGWGGVLPKFQRAGFVVLRSGVVSFGERTESAATEAFFGLLRWESQKLFWDWASVYHIKTPKQWAKACRAHIKEYRELKNAD